MILLSIDPGKHHAGYALFVDDKLVLAGIEKYKAPKTAPALSYRVDLPTSASQAALEIAERIAGKVLKALQRLRRSAREVIEVVCEFMHVFSTNNANPEGLLFCQLVGGAIASAVNVFVSPARLRCVEAKTWKGQRSDAATWELCRSPLKLDEEAIAKSCGTYDDKGEHGKSFHHGLEAIGIGLWALWRI